MVAKYRLAEEMVPVGTRSDTPVVYVGRVCVATEAGDGKINATSVLLEGIMADGGKRVALDLSELGGFSLFPGQVIAVRGINAVGYRMVVQALYHGIAAPPPVMRACNARAVAQAAMKAGGGPLRVWTAVGPYCCHSDLTFQPLRDLLTEATAAATPPDVLVLVRGSRTGAAVRCGTVATMPLCVQSPSRRWGLSSMRSTRQSRAATWCCMMAPRR